MALKYLNSMYVRPQTERDPQTGKNIVKQKDFLLYTIKDTETNETHLKIVDEPKVKFYVANAPQQYAAISIPKIYTREVECNYANRDLVLATTLNRKDEFWNSVRNGTKWELMRDIMKHPDLYMGDVDIEDFYKSMFTWTHGEALISPYKKAYADTEVDISDYAGFPYAESAPCPINTINHLDETTRIMYSFVLRDTRNPQIAVVEADLEGFVKEHMIPELDPSDYDIQFVFKFVDTEKEIITEYFKMLHITKPDFLTFWNIDYDFLTIVNRMKRLGMDPAQVMCHPSIPPQYRYVHYHRDESKPTFGGDSTKNEGHPSRKWNWPTIAGFTQMYDQMSLYSNMRKRYTLPSYSLDNIGASEVGVKKVDYRAMGYTLKTLIRGNFALFLRYAIKDVYVQYRIEKKVNDLDKYILFTGNTRLSKGVSISYVIKNSLMDSFWKDGDIIGNTVNYDIREIVPGAIVSDPTLMARKGIIVNGVETYVFNNVIDLDAASMYPNLMIAANVAKSTLRGRIYAIVRRHEEGEVQHKMSGSEFNSALQTLDSSILDLGKELYGLPTIDEMIAEIEGAF